MGEDHSPDGWQVDQAVEFVRALRFQLRKMTAQLASIERMEATGRNAGAGSRRTEAAELRQDIDDARLLVNRLERAYLSRMTADLRSQVPARSRATPP